MVSKRASSTATEATQSGSSASNAVANASARNDTTIGKAAPKACDNTILAIDLLQDFGINAADINKLKATGIHTIQSAHVYTKRKMEKIKGLSEVKVLKIKEALTKILPSEIETGSDALKRREKCVRITTGSKQFDNILCGGFQLGSVCEVFGEFRCGKTQIAHTLAVTAQLPEELGGAAGKVLWFDTEGTYRPERIQQICTRFEVDPEQVLDNIQSIRLWNSEQQDEIMDLVAPELASGDYRLVIVDSIMNLFRSDYIGRGELYDRQTALAGYLRKLVMYAEQCNILVFLTNQVQSDPGASALFASVDGRKPVGGHVLAHASTTRVLLRKGRGEERVAKIIDSPEAAEREGTYIITEGGIADPQQI